MRTLTPRRRRGFTLVELMMVVVIIGILAGIVAVSVGGADEEARVGEARSEVRALFDAVEMFKLRTGGYLPETLEELIEGPPDYEGRWQNLLQSPEVPLDPWDKEYIYEITDADWGEYQIICQGRDGEPGGEGFAADIMWPESTE